MKFKAKGKYEWRDLPHHKNQSALVVKMAVEEYIIHGTNPEDFIRNHQNSYDFMLRVKVPRSSKLVLVDEDGNDHQIQNISRYYVSTKGGDMVKIMPPIEPTKTEQVWENVDEMDEVVISSKADIAKYEKKGYKFVKEVETECPERRFNIEAGWKTKITNDIKDFDWDINYDYYIERTWKLIDFADGDDVVESED